MNNYYLNESNQFKDKDGWLIIDGHRAFPYPDCLNRVNKIDDITNDILYNLRKTVAELLYENDPYFRQFQHIDYHTEYKNLMNQVLTTLMSKIGWCIHTNTLQQEKEKYIFRSRFNPETGLHEVKLKIK